MEMHVQFHMFGWGVCLTISTVQLLITCSNWNAKDGRFIATRIGLQVLGRDCASSHTPFTHMPHRHATADTYRELRVCMEHAPLHLLALSAADGG
jgi:hypothetical protein